MEHPYDLRFKPAHLPSNEQARLAMVRRSDLMDATNIARFDIDTRLFRHIAGVPVAYTGLIDDMRPHFLSENFTGCFHRLHGRKVRGKPRRNDLRES